MPQETPENDKDVLDALQRWADGLDDATRAKALKALGDSPEDKTTEDDTPA